MTESQFEILRAADSAFLRRLRCIGTRTITILSERPRNRSPGRRKQVGGQLGRPSGARFRTYERLKNHAERVEGTLFDTEPLRRAVDDIYRYPLRQAAVDTLNRQLRSGISDDDLAALVVELREDGRLCVVHEQDEPQEPRIICSMGLIGPEAR